MLCIWPPSHHVHGPIQPHKSTPTEGSVFVPRFTEMCRPCKNGRLDGNVLRLLAEGAFWHYQFWAAVEAK